MGQLFTGAANLGTGIAESMSGAYGPDTLSGNLRTAMGLTTLQGGLQATGELFGGLAGLQAGLYQSQIATNNSRTLQQAQRTALESGQYSEEIQKIRTGELVGEQKAAQGANQADVNSGSAQKVRASTQALGDLDAMAIHYNAAKEAWGYGVEASAKAAEAQQLTRGAWGSLAGGILGASDSLLSTATSLGAKWRTFQTQTGLSSIPTGGP